MSHRLANLERYQAMLDKRSSSAAEKHQDRRTRRSRSRQDARRQAIRFAS